jgi:hypothetical protein
MAVTALVDYRERKTHACWNENSQPAYLCAIAVEIICGLTLWVLRHLDFTPGSLLNLDRSKVWEAYGFEILF